MALHLTRLIRAPRAAVYRALIDPIAIAAWKVPDGMTAEIHTFEAWEGGRFRVSLTYDAPDAVGKTTAHTDTYGGHFRRLVPDSEVVEVTAFETTDPQMQGEMIGTFHLQDTVDGTLLTATHQDVPPGVSPEDNHLGWSMALDKLARWVEGDR